MTTFETPAAPATPAAPVSAKEIRFPEVLDGLRRHRAMIAATTLGAAALSMAATLVFDRPVYESTARVLVAPVTLEPFEDREEGVPDMPDERENVYSDAVAARARERTGWDAPLDSFRSRVSVSVAGGTDVLAITYEATSAAHAREGAQAFADAYLAERARKAAAIRDGRRRDLITSLTEINRRSAAPRRQLATSQPDSPEALAAVSKLESLTAEAAPLQTRMADVTTLGAGPVGEVLLPAEVPGGPTEQPILFNTAASAFLGLLAGGGLAFRRHTTGGRERSRVGLEERLRAPVLAEVPRTRRRTAVAAAAATGSPAGAGTAGSGSWLVTLRLPDSRAAESYRRLRARLLAIAQQRPLRTVMVAGAGDDAVHSAIAANLAVSMAATGRRVTLVAANLTGSQIPESLELDNEWGLSNVLAGEIPAGAASRHPEGLDTLEVVVPGPQPAHADDLLESFRMREVLADHGRDADFVVVEAPAALRSAGWLTLAPLVDGILVVADARHARGDELAEVRHQFDQVGGEIVGVVVCNADGR